MLRKGHYRQVFEMGQEGQEKTESVSGMESPKNFPEFHTPNAPKGTKGRKLQEVYNFMIRKSFQNFVPFVPLRGFWAFRAYRIVTFPCGGGIVKVTKLNTPNTLTGSEVRFPPVERPSTGQARGVGEQDYEQHNPDRRGETARGSAWPA